MLWYEIIFLIIAAFCFAGIVYFLVKKFPLAARVDIANLAETKQQEIKKNMLEQRLRRLLLERTKIWRTKVQALLKVLKNILLGLYHDLLEKEKQLLNKRRQSKSAAVVGMNSLQQRLSDLLIAAQEHMKKDEFVEAERKFLEIISLDPKNIDAFEGLGDIYVELKKYNEAKEVFKFLLRLSNAEAYFHNKLGQVARAQGHLQEAEAQFRLSVETSNQNANYLYNLADVFVMENEYDQAVEYFEKALALEPKNPKYLDALLNISIIRKDKVRAGQILNVLKEVNPENNKISEWREQIESL